MKLIYYSTLFFLTSLTYASTYYPSSIIKLSNNSELAIIVEKSTHTLFLYENKNSEPSLKKTYQIATGKVAGLKLREGDKKTPEGIYHIQKFLSPDDLKKMYGETYKIYGPGAFTLDYPNEIDRIEKRSGSGIWLHSTDDDSRIQKGLDSRGCVVATQSDFLELQELLMSTKTPVILTEELSFLTKKSWLEQKSKLKQTFTSWSNAWKEKDFKTYIAQYSPEFKNSRKGSYHKYKRYKRRIFRKKDSPQINFSNITILKDKEYAMITMIQDYKSEFINDIGFKKLILKKDRYYNWKIIREIWRSIPKEIRL